jgi:hypothetical protein
MGEFGQLLGARPELARSTPYAQARMGAQPPQAPSAGRTPELARAEHAEDGELHQASRDFGARVERQQHGVQLLRSPERVAAELRDYAAAEAIRPRPVALVAHLTHRPR